MDLPSGRVPVSLCCLTDLVRLLLLLELSVGLDSTLDVDGGRDGPAAMADVVESIVDGATAATGGGAESLLIVTLPVTLYWREIDIDMIVFSRIETRLLRCCCVCAPTTTCLLAPYCMIHQSIT